MEADVVYYNRGKLQALGASPFTVTGITAYDQLDQLHGMDEPEDRT